MQHFYFRTSPKPTQPNDLPKDVQKKDQEKSLHLKPTIISETRTVSSLKIKITNPDSLKRKAESTGLNFNG